MVWWTWRLSEAGARRRHGRDECDACVALNALKKKGGFGASVSQLHASAGGTPHSDFSDCMIAVLVAVRVCDFHESSIANARLMTLFGV